MGDATTSPEAADSSGAADARTEGDREPSTAGGRRTNQAEDAAEDTGTTSPATEETPVRPGAEPVPQADAADADAPAADPVGNGAPEAAPAGRQWRAWLAGVAAAVVAAVLGGIFTGWWGATGPDALRSLTGEPPLHVIMVRTEEGPLALETPVTAPGERAALLPGASEEQFGQVVRAHKGAGAGRLDVTVVLEGARGSVRIVDIVPRVRASGSPLTGAYFAPTTAGEVGTVALSADMDAPRPGFSAGGGSKAYFRQKQIDLARGEQTTVVMSFTARQASYAFDLQVTVSADGKAQTLTLAPQDGGLFRVTGLPRKPQRYARVYVRSAGAWVVAAGPQRCKALRQLDPSC
ncbi:hypothetical protein [Peterkaempfera bronchialis]|uniref:hypothetical protein n=1 Tax=Peterkaempfera bronchialis TaxID=2126346 RepID=UPI003C3050DA